MMKKKSDILYFDDQKIELNEEEKDLLYPNDKIREKTYCFCKRTEEEAVGLTMIECDSCHDWFHDECIGIPQSEMELLDIYYCPSCLSKPIKYSKREPSNADLDLLLTALEELTEEKPKLKKKKTRLNFPKVTLFHFFEPVMINYLTVAGFMKNESSSVNEDNKIIVPITKEDLEKGTLWTS
jgi:Chromatin remodeling protein, contains PhD zinc finger